MKPVTIIVILTAIFASVSVEANETIPPAQISTEKNVNELLCAPCPPQGKTAKISAAAQRKSSRSDDLQVVNNIYINYAESAFQSLTGVSLKGKKPTTSCTSVVLDFVKAVVPLAQTLAWIVLILVLLKIYNQEVKAIIETIRKRVQSGSGLKMGPVSIEADFHPQSTDQQAKEAEKEVAEATTTTTTTPPPMPPPMAADIKRKGLQAEDLALRAIQAEYGVPIKRQLQAGSDLFVDGMFSKDGTAYIVEVKYSRGSYPTARVMMLLNKILAGITRYHWQNVKVILAIVYDGQVDITAEETRLLESIKGTTIILEVRCFTFEQLTEKFGI